jgi:hypothetical protein
MLTLLAVAAPAEAQDPSWTVIRPDVTWANQWSVQPAAEPLFAVLDESIYRDERPRLSGDRAVATRPRERFSVGFEDVAAAGDDFSGGAVWVHLAIRRGTRVDVAVRTRRGGRVTIVSRRARLTPPIVVVPEDPPRGRRGFRGWIDLTLPALTRVEVNSLSLSARISPSSPHRSLARAHASFAELYPTP